jgi:hypothetical protein
MSASAVTKTQSKLSSFFTPPEKLAPLVTKRRHDDESVVNARTKRSAKASAVVQDDENGVLSQLRAVANESTTSTVVANTNVLLSSTSSSSSTSLSASLAQFGSGAPRAAQPPQFAYKLPANALKQKQSHQQQKQNSDLIDLTADEHSAELDKGDAVFFDVGARRAAGTAGGVFEAFAFNSNATPSVSTNVSVEPRPIPLSLALGTGSKKVKSPQKPHVALPLLSSLKGSASVRSSSLNVAVPSDAAMMSDDVRMLTDEQRAVFALVERGENVFFTGSAGTGKSLLISVLITHLRKRWGDEAVAVTASTGAAAVNIGGTTLHTFAGIGLGNKPVGMLAEAAKRNEQVRRRWQHCKYLIVDEISMIPPDLLDKIEYVARFVRSQRGRPNMEPFGGICIVLAGDFLQLPPVPERGQPQTETKYAFQSQAWQMAVRHKVVLRQVHRQRDERFVNLLNDLRRGVYTDAARTLLTSRVNVPLSRPVRLYSRRVDVAQENGAELARLPGELIRYTARDTCKFEQYREQLDKFCNAPAQLELKVGAQVMLLKNLSVTDGLVNGSQGVVTSFSADKRRMPTVVFANGLERIIEPTEWTIEVGGVECAKRNQVPLMLAWAISIHKSQGLTLDEATCDLGSCFTTGQAYVALSRVRSLNGLSISSLPRSFATDPIVTDFYAQIEASQTAN